MLGNITINKTGLRAIETYYEPIMNKDYDSVIAYRTQVRVNDPHIGVLLPQIYLPVAERTTLANKISLWAINDISSTVPKLKSRGAYFEFIAVYVPVDLLISEEFCMNFLKALKENGASASDICIEVSSSIFTYDIKIIQRALLKFSENGIKTMLSGLGIGSAFIGRLEKLHFDYIILDNILSNNLVSTNEREIAMANSIFELVSAQGSIAIATGVNNMDIKHSLPKACVNFTGNQAGRIKKAVSIR